METRLEELDAAIQADPTNARLMEKKVKFSLQHNPQEALKVCGKLLARNPKHVYALTHGAKAAMAMKKSEMALGYAGRALAEQDGPGVRLILAQIYQMRGRLDIAEQQYRKTLELDPGNAAAVHGLKHLAKMKKSSSR